ncbi:MAG TPA: NfeD family protein, partial [Spirochaetota bacterium]|nr:NfeD family protein [Spirochaetota bacterium]
DEEIELSREKHGYDLPGDKLLTLTAEESLQVKVSEAVVADADQLLQKIDVAGHTVNYIKPRTFHKILKLFSNQIILGLLITLGTLGMIFEIKTAGWGLGGTLAVLALALFFIIQISLGHADWKIPLIFVVGIGLILVEIFIIPGFGIVGLAGILTSIAALFLSFGINNTETALASAAIAVLGITVGTFVLFKYLPDSRIMHKISLNDTNQTKVKSRELKGIKPGSSGIVVSDLRPVGKVKINRHVIEAQSNLGFISAGEKIKVETISGNRVVVNKI